MNGRLKRRRSNLFIDNPHCYWCNRLLKEYSAEEIRKLNGQVPDDKVTIDHLNSRVLFPEGRPYNPDREATVLACRKCNGERATDEVAGITWVPYKDWHT